MFFGRKEQLESLASLWGKRVSSLVTCRGRRRIGKSTLIKEFAKKTSARFIKIEGARPEDGLSNKDALRAFVDQLAAQTRCERSLPENWLEAFIRLDREIKDGEKTVVLLDEISWMGYYDPMFANMVRIAWENYWKSHDRLVLVLCGSVSSWIKEHFIDNASYMGRRSLDLVVGELPLAECVKFWGRAAERVATKEIIDVLSVTGGVPRYLEEVNPSLSADENIRRMCFLPNGILRTDFEEMFTDVITHQPAFTARVLDCLVDGPRSVSDIAKQIGEEKNGRMSSALVRLSESGFVSEDAGKNPETGADVRERKYRLKDNYARFYLKYIAPVKNSIDAGMFRFSGVRQFSGWDAVMGLQFENLVVNNAAELLSPLHMERSLVLSAAPYFRRASASSGNEGVQIDLLLQAKMSYCIVEVKRKASIGRDVIAEVERKRRLLPHPRNVSVRTALVYDGELAPSIEADGYFDAIVKFSDLLFVAT